MKRLFVTQRVTTISAHGERRDSLDQQWVPFLFACGVLPILIPNHLTTVVELMNDLRPDGILLTNGDDLAANGGHVPERDETERYLIGRALEEQIPLLGVCRGMQAIQDYFGVRLERVSGHVQREQTIYLNGQPRDVNSYHNWGTTQTVDPLEVIGVAEDGVVKAVRVSGQEVYGIMWHPERFVPHRAEDIEWLRQLFGGEKGGQT